MSAIITNGPDHNAPNQEVSAMAVEANMGILSLKATQHSRLHNAVRPLVMQLIAAREVSK